MSETEFRWGNELELRDSRIVRVKWVLQLFEPRVTTHEGKQKFTLPYWLKLGVRMLFDRDMVMRPAWLEVKNDCWRKPAAEYPM
jgi:hypothetical protein